MPSTGKGVDNTLTAAVELKALQELLEAQYPLTENYCDARTSLYNAYLDRRQGGGHGSSSTRNQYDLIQSVRAYQQATSEVQDFVARLEETAARSREPGGGDPRGSSGIGSYPAEFRRLVGEHARRTRRVLATLPPVIHPDGVVMSSSVDEDAALQALSSTRAFVRVVQAELGRHLVFADPSNVGE